MQINGWGFSFRRKKIYRIFFYTFQEPEINDTKIIESEKTPVEEDLELDVLDMEGMKLDSDQGNLLKEIDNKTVRK